MATGQEDSNDSAASATGLLPDIYMISGHSRGVINYSVRWDIKGFSTRREEFDSPRFEVADGGIWRIHIHPRSRQDNPSQKLYHNMVFNPSQNQYESIRIELGTRLISHPKKEVNARFTLSAIGSKKVKKVHKCSLTKFVENQCASALYIRNGMVVADDQVSPNDDKLTVWLDIDIESESGESQISLVSAKKLPSFSFSQFFEGLLRNPSFSDVTFIVQGTEIPVHKLVLVSRSPVFKAMFSHDIAENNEGKVIIDDFKPEVIKEMLHYMYTGTCPPNLKVMARDILPAAVKYQMNELQLLCEEELCRSVSLDNALDLVALADTYNATFLKETVTKFLKLNCEQMMEKVLPQLVQLKIDNILSEEK